ncbi:MAG: NAD(P) transhydrogenase subunit alpha [Nitratireductor sp.]|nr:NAD(P) transhydrogenase subunit alpha [Nitratireductor sp.]
MSEASEKALEAARALAEQSRALAEKASEIANQAAEAAQLAVKNATEATAAASQSGADSGASQTAAVIAHGMTGGAVDPFVFQFAIFVMAIFVGYYVVWSVTPALHTPLMSVTNAISSVIVVGALLAVGIEAASGVATFFGFAALVLASVNIFGGFLVTQRMLAMYKKKEK